MRKGVVIEVDERFVTLLTPDGQFVKANNVRGSYELGEEISFFPKELSRVKRKASISRLQGRIALALALVMLFSISFLTFQKKDVYAYMTIDINPSFELEMDSDLLVTDIEPLNEDAKQIVKEISNWENRPIKIVTDKIIFVTENAGYLKKNQEIIIATIINSKEKKSDEKLEKELNEVKKTFNDKQIDIKTIKSDIDTRKKAENEGISTGKYIEKETKEKQKEGNQKEKTEADTEQRALIQKETVKEEVNTENRDLAEEKEIQNEAKTPPRQLKKEEKKEEKQLRKQERKEERQIRKQERKEERQLRKQERKEERQLMRQEKKELRQQMREKSKEVNKS